MISQDMIHDRSARASEDVLVALIRSGLSKDEKKKVLHAINGKWEKPESVRELQQLADDLLNKLDPDFAAAANELCKDLSVKPEDINPIIVVKEKDAQK